MPFTTYIIPETGKKKTPISFKPLWVVTDHALLPAHQEILHKICQALKADFELDVFHLICPSGEPISIAEFNYEKTSLVISFGILPATLGLWIDIPSPGIRYLESFAFILSVKLNDLINQPSSKKQLWSSMQLYLQKAESPK